MMNSDTDRPRDPTPGEPDDLSDLTPQERADFEAFVQDEAAVAEDELPSPEVAASLLAASSDLLDDATSLTATDDPALGPLTLKEAYGEGVGAALEWSDSAQLCAVHSGQAGTEALVDADGLADQWRFIYCNAAGQLFELAIIHGQLRHTNSAYSGPAGQPFALEDLLDSPELIAQARDAGLDGDAFTIIIARDAQGALQATVGSGGGELVLNAAITE
jgi:hypothetical protein